MRRLGFPSAPGKFALVVEPCVFPLFGVMVYGASGYVGEYVARTAGRLEVKAIVAGRDATKLDRIASETGLTR